MFLRRNVVYILVCGFSLFQSDRIAHAQHACCFSDQCQSIETSSLCESQGGVYLDAADCSNDPCRQGACCNTGSCGIIDAYRCVTSGRTFGGAGTTCFDDPCGDGVGACCLADGGCDIASPENCASINGTWLGAGTNCIVDRCELGSCCLPGQCLDIAEYQCISEQGIFHSGISCSQNGCEIENNCPDNSLYSQVRKGANYFGAWISETTADGSEQAHMWDNYYNNPGPVESIKWYGLDLTPNLDNCVDNPIEFEISFYEDREGELGPVVCSHIVNPVRSPTGIFYNDTFELIEYQSLLPEPCPLNRGWLTIAGMGSTDCIFLWINSFEGDNHMKCEGCELLDLEDDLNFCLIGTAGGVTGACCDEAKGICTDDVDMSQCYTIGNRFVAGATCDSLDPPCRQKIGACCNLNNTCTLEPEANCFTDHEVWLGSDTTCDQCPQRGACCIDEGDCFENVVEIDCLERGYTWAGPDTVCNADCFTRPLCPENSLFSRKPYGPNGFEAFGNEEGSIAKRWVRVEDVPGFTDSLTWWGLELEPLGGSAFALCEDLAAEFDIQFLNDSGGVPGDVVCSYSVVATRTPKEINYRGVELIEYSATLPESCLLTDGWVSIVGKGDPSCFFMWMSAYQGYSFCDTCAVQVPNEGLSICLQGTEGGAMGACCDDDGASCTDDVDIAACIQDGFRFENETLCDDLDPYCGADIGACCFAHKECSILEETECMDLGGLWNGSDSLCPSCPCYIPIPPDAVEEGEPDCYDGYVDEFNSGCFGDAEAFSPIDLCQTIVGKSGITNDSPLPADYDWYKIELTEPARLHWTVEAEFPVLAGIVSGNFGCEGAPTLAAATGRECEQITLTEPVLEGTYYLVVVPSGANDAAACGTAHYVARLTSDANCPGDADGDGDFDTDDWKLFSLCLTGPRGRVVSECEVFDINKDLVVDMQDAGLFMRMFTGPQ